MQVILLQNVKKVGKKYEIKEVASGFAQNSLIPKKLAIPATPEAKRKLQNQINLAEKSDEKVKQKVLDTFKKLDGAVVEVSLKANDKGSLYAKLNNTDVAGYIKTDIGLDVDTSYIELENNITETGEYSLTVSAFDTKVKFTLNITSE